MSGGSHARLRASRFANIRLQFNISAGYIMIHPRSMSWFHCICQLRELNIAHANSTYSETSSLEPEALVHNPCVPGNRSELKQPLDTYMDIRTRAVSTVLSSRANTRVTIISIPPFHTDNEVVTLANSITDAYLVHPLQCYFITAISNWLADNVTHCAFRVLVGGNNRRSRQTGRHISQ